MEKDLIKCGLDGTSHKTDCSCKAETIGLGNSLVQFIAQDSANKLDSREQLINEQDMVDALSEDMLSVLEQSKWKRLRKRLGKELSLNGKALLVIDIIEGNPFISIGKLVSYTEIAGSLKEVVLDAYNIVEHAGTEYPVFEVFTLEGTTVQKMNAIQVEGKWIEQGDIMYYPENITRIPVKIFINNEDETSDINNTSMWDAIEALNNLSNRLIDTIDKSQFGVIVNRNMTGGKTANDVIKGLKNGAIEVNGMDAQLGAGIAPIGALGYTTELLMNIDWLEDKILKYTFTTRDSVSTGTNKHNAEIGMFNQPAIEYLIDKKEIREEDYADFYSILSMFFGEEESYEVELQISEIFENLIKSMDPETQQGNQPQENDKEKETEGDE